MNNEQARRNMVEQQVRPWDVLDPRVLDLMETLPRERFFEDNQAGLAYADLELPLHDGGGALALSPRLVGRIAQAAAPQATETVLEIGTGSGYLTAVLAGMAAQVDSFEQVEALKIRSRSTLDEVGIDNVQLRTQKISREWTPPRARYDVIVVTGSMADYDPFLEPFLAVGGRLLAVVGDAPVMRLERHLCVAPGAVQVERLVETCVLPLAGFERHPVFEF